MAYYLNAACGKEALVVLNFIVVMRKGMQWPYGQYAGLSVKRSGSETWLGSLCCIHSTFLDPGVQMGTSGLSGRPD